MTVSLASLKKNPKLLAAALAHAKKEHNEENLLFWFDKGNAEALWSKYIRPGSPKQVNLPATVVAPMKVLADAKNFKDDAWKEHIAEAKEEIEKLWNGDMAPRFKSSEAYEEATRKKVTVDPAKAAKLLGITDTDKLKKAMEAQRAGKKAAATKLLAELAEEEGLKQKADALLKALEKAGLT
jgi:hypothetical protein